MQGLSRNLPRAARTGRQGRRWNKWHHFSYQKINAKVLLGARTPLCWVCATDVTESCIGYFKAAIYTPLQV